ncbi:MAG: hypothetical protein K1X82_00465 [Bacteroidia bacterium]|nr:hypothetical protein [Bacteroidia bacterium]
MNKLLILFSLFLSLVFTHNASGQDVSMEKTIEYINGKLSGKYTIDVKKGYLTIECFENGKLIRRDVVELMAVNAEDIVFGIKEKQVIIKCRFDQAECIDRVLPEAGKKTQVSRTAIALEPDGKSEAGLVKAFTHMAKLIQYRKYSSQEWFE